MNLYLIYGGKSAEHDVSLKSAYSILQIIYYDYYSVIPVYITRDGQWLKGKTIETKEQVPTKEELHQIDQKETFIFNEMMEEESVAFPVLHGPNGEDGTVQGLFEVLDISYVGAELLTSAVGMDKIMSKRIFKDAGLPVLPFEEVRLKEWTLDPQEVMTRVEADMNYPLYVKPVNMGSSVGVTKADNREELELAITLAFEYDSRIMIEKGEEVREIEVALLGNEDIHTSVPGELVKHKSFYDYEDKYLNDKVIRQVPADISDELTKELRQLAVKAFHAINGSGVSRVDFFLTEDNRVYINEINTFPGFTQNSMYPRVWAKTGLPYADLIEEVIQLGIRRYKDKKQMTTQRKDIDDIDLEEEKEQ
ncbi:D-alanine--D-alanine ligase [Alkalibacterium iburiense]|uniref:D-alanine--D-alanine ligase n=1 Tax=Alkalibacterium iburiense TaxID=290589 RepID=A0ABN0XGG8_9LACT